MVGVAERLVARDVESTTRALWTRRNLPRAGNGWGPPGGLPVHRFLGSPTFDESHLSYLERLVFADADARVATMVGRRVAAETPVRRPRSVTDPTVAAGWRDALGIWSIRDAVDDDISSLVQPLVDRLATQGLLVSREGPIRVCPSCAIPRTPEAIVYVEENGPAYLVRFPIQGSQPKLSALVWVDALWKLLGTGAILLNPDVEYVSVLYRRRGVEEFLLVARSALDRLPKWLPGCELAVVESRRGSEWAGAVFEHPLRVEYPPLAEQAAPAGTVLESAEVGDSGTGIVALVPSHGGSDAFTAHALRVPGSPVVGADGLVESRIAHKYAGLKLSDAEAFVNRDLTDAGYLFAQLRVRRGIPRCATCGTAMIWVPARVWALEPTRLAPPLLSLFSQLLPDEPTPRAGDVVPWPASDRVPSTAAGAVTLVECLACERLAPSDAQGPCPCGGSRTAVRRQLSPAVADALAAWARTSPLAAGSAVRLYVSERRRASAVIHHLVGMQATGAQPSESRLAVLPLMRGPGLTLDENEPADAWRAAFLRSPSAVPDEATFVERRRQEARRLARFWSIVATEHRRMAADGYALVHGSIVTYWNSLGDEERSLISSFERMRLDVRRLLDAGDYPKAHDRLTLFVERTLAREYLAMVEARFVAEVPAAGRTATHHALTHILPRWAELYAPFAPFLMEAVSGSFRSDGASLFDGGFSPVLETTLDEKRESLFATLVSVAAAARRGRATLGLARHEPVARLVIVARDEATGEALRSALEAVRRVTLSTEVEVGSPNHPWAGRTVRARPIPAEIRRVYPGLETRVSHLIDQLGGARVVDGIRSGSLSIALDGRPITILPSMVEATVEVPKELHAVPWELGEMYAALPADATPPRGLPPLSFSGFRVAREIGRSLRVPAGTAPPPEVFVAVEGDLRRELELQATALARALGVGKVILSDSSARFVPSETRYGTTGRGVEFRIWVPGQSVHRPAAKARSSRGHPRAEAPSARAAAEEAGPSPAEEESWAREAAIRETLAELDSRIGTPYLGPTKLGYAWNAGFRNADDLLGATYDQLVVVPGFGRSVAAEIVRKMGGVVPEPPPRVRAEAAAQEPTPVVIPPEVAPVPVVAPTVTSPLPRMLPPEPIPRREEPAPPDGWSSPAVVPKLELPPAPPPRAAEPGPLPVPELEPAPLPPVPEPVPPEPPAPAHGPIAGVFVWPDASPDDAWRRFLDTTGAGIRGLCVSREFPERMQAYVGPRDVEVVWLSNAGAGRKAAIKPSDLHALEEYLRKAVVDRGVLAIYLDAVEYLARLHTADALLGVFRRLNETMKEHDARMWLPVNPALVGSGFLERLSAELPRADGAP